MSAQLVHVEDYAGVALVSIHENSLLESNSIAQIGRQLQRLVEIQQKCKIVLDLLTVRLLSSQFLGILASLNTKCEAGKGRFVLCGLRPELLKVFAITGLDAVLKIYKTDAEALKSFGIRVE